MLVHIDVSFNSGRKHALDVINIKQTNREAFRDNKITDTMSSAQIHKNNRIKHSKRTF